MVDRNGTARLTMCQEIRGSVWHRSGHPQYRSSAANRAIHNGHHDARSVVAMACDQACRNGSLPDAQAPRQRSVDVLAPMPPRLFASMPVWVRAGPQSPEYHPQATRVQYDSNTMG